MNELDKLPHLPVEAMGPCIACGRQLLATELPIFFRISAKQCGIDGSAVRQHVGLAMSMGGGADGLALAGILGPRVEPVIVMDEITAFNVCHGCATDGVGLLDVIGRQWEGDKARERP